MFEHKSEKLAPLSVFLRRMAMSLAIAVAAIGVSLAVGVCGYHWIGGLDWIDALLNASMILGGMGPVDPLNSPEAKVFASVYALFSGLFLIFVTGIVLAPVAHRLLHKLHIDDRDLEED